MPTRRATAAKRPETETSLLILITYKLTHVYSALYESVCFINLLSSNCKELVKAKKGSVQMSSPPSGSSMPQKMTEASVTVMAIDSSISGPPNLTNSRTE